MALLNTWASQQDQATLSPLSRLLNNYIQQSDAPLAYLMRGDAQGLLKDLNTPKPVNTTQDMTNLALNLNPVMGLIGATAYHGSPAIFDKFDIKKLGSGEGAQSYGHGMYFAENPKTAEQYAKDLGTEITVNNKPLFKANQITGTTGNEAVDDYLLMHHGDINKALTSINNDYNIVKNTNPKGAESYLPNIKALEKLQKSNAVKVNNTGNIYKVDIPDEYMPKMLDWFKPLSEQTDEVKKALSNLPHRSKDWTFKDTLQTLNAASHTKDIPGMNPTGQEIYSMIGRGLMTGNKAQGQKYASDLLSKQGISGIKYLDSGSRATGGTNNLVVFDPTQVKILERNNKGLLK
jgi:hypothetical protein